MSKRETIDLLGGSNEPVAYIELPPPRIWSPENLADFFQVSVSWVYKLKYDPDPPPRCPMTPMRFDTANPDFQNWLRRRLGLD